MKIQTQRFHHQQGISLIIVVVLIAVISAIVLPMARTTILEEKISKNHNWLNLAYTEARGEVYRQSSAKEIELSNLLKALSNSKTPQASNLADHETEIHFRGQNGTPYGYSIDRFKGFQFDVITEADKEATGNYNKQLMGITYVANSNSN